MTANARKKNYPCLRQRAAGILNHDGCQLIHSLGNQPSPRLMPQDDAFYLYCHHSSMIVLFLKFGFCLEKSYDLCRTFEVEAV